MARALFNIAVGDRVAIEGHVFVLDAMIPSAVGLRDEIDEFQFKDIRIGRATTFTNADFMALYNDGKVRLLSPTERVTDRFPVRKSLKANDVEGDLTADAALEKGKRRLRYLKAFDAAPVSRSTKCLATFIAQIATDIDDPAPPSAGALRRWIAARGGPNCRRLGDAVGRHPKGMQGSRLQPRVQEILSEESERFYGSRLVQVRDIWDLVTHRINLENAEPNGSNDVLRRPSMSTVWRWLKTNMTFDRAKSRLGAAKATQLFGVIKGSMQADSILDIAIIDHTILDCWVIDDVTLQPIGRPRLTVLLDACSRMVLGFNVSWANAGLDAALATLRHAFRDKTYVRTKYPQIKNEWPAMGQPRTIVVDQGLEFTGTTFEDICLSLGMNYEPAPARTPQYKGEIERFFGTINTGAIHKLKGSVPLKPQQMKEFGLDPERDAVAFLSDIERVIHQWIIDLYSLQKHSSLDKSPAKAWYDRLSSDVIDLCPNLEELDRACSRSKKVRLTREGIKTFRNLNYRCPELAQLRVDVAAASPSRGISKQGSAKVNITYQSEDISRIFVWNPKTGSSIEVPCVQANYAKGLSENLHQQVREHAARTNAEFTSEAEMCANRVAFLELIEEICAPKVRDRKRLQIYRHPARLAQQDVVQMSTVTSDGSIGHAVAVEVSIDPIRNRDRAAPKEKRPLLKARSKARSAAAKPSQKAAPEAETTGETAFVSKPSTGLDWQSLAADRRRRKLEATG